MHCLRKPSSASVGWCGQKYTPASGALDLARTVVRRAERRCLSVPGVPPEAMAYLNRMSLLIFILGRYEEHSAGVETMPAKTSRT